MADRPQLRWSFQHVVDPSPAAPILPADDPAELPRSHAEVESVLVTYPSTGVALTFGEVMSSTVTDGWIVAGKGAFCRRRTH